METDRDHPEILECIHNWVKLPCDNIGI